jgi:hypothetical protein
MFNLSMASDLRAQAQQKAMIYDRLWRLTDKTGVPIQPRITQHENSLKSYTGFHKAVYLDHTVI